MSKNCNFVGIDVAKNDFYACFEENGESKRFNNSKTGIKEFISCLRRKKFTKSETTIGLESTGSYHLRLCLQCSDFGFRIKILNPLVVKKQNQTSLRRVKNDKKDAALIRYCVSVGAGYEFMDNEDTLILKSLVRQRNSLANSTLKIKRQIEDVKYKEDCLNIKLNPVYEEIDVILREKVKSIEKHLKLFRKDEQKLLQSIPGVGPITAVSFIAEIVDVKRFKEAKKWWRLLA